MQLKLTIEMWQKGKWFIARCPELDIVSQGESKDEARQNLNEVIAIQFEQMVESGTLEDYLIECGYARENDMFVPKIEMVALERSMLEVA